MSLWNTPEDIENRRYEWNTLGFNSPFGSYDDFNSERQKVLEAKNKIGIIKAANTSERTEQNHMQREENYRYLVYERDSMYYRINLGDSVLPTLNSSIIKMLIMGLRSELLLLSGEVAEAIVVSDINVKCDALTDEAREKTEKTYVIQLLTRIRLAIANASEVTKEEMQPIADDVRTLIFRFGYTQKTDEEIMSFFAEETGYLTTVCKECGRKTTSFFDKCLHCGKTANK